MAKAKPPKWRLRLAAARDGLSMSSYARGRIGSVMIVTVPVAATLPENFRESVATFSRRTLHP
jgi:hypothetical protein